MNPLETLIAKHSLCPVKVMDLLQNHGKVSDCCIGPETVAPSDCAVAIRFLHGLSKEEKASLNKSRPALSEAGQ